MPARWMPHRVRGDDLSAPDHRARGAAMTPTLAALSTFMLVTTSIGGLLFALFLPRLLQGNHLRQRRDVALGLRAGTGQSGAGQSTAGMAGGSGRQMRRSIEDTLRELEQKNKAPGRWRMRTSLKERLRAAGLSWSRATYGSICVVLGLVVAAALALGLGAGAALSAGVGLATGLWVPHAYVTRRIKSRRFAFTTGFPDALDIIVRGVRSGIPIADCMRIVATESEDPVRSEFRTTVEDLTMGLPVDEAVQRMSERVTLEEARFFSIVITIQSRTGGNLSEALANLSVVLRDRAKMRGKIRAMSSEAKASASIIGALPPMVCLLVFLTSPEYVGLLFSTVAGNAVLAGSGLWMLCGIGIMRNMINFDF